MKAINSLFVILTLSAAHPGLGLSFAVVDTAQDTCFNASTQVTCPASDTAFFGQDAQHFGIQPSYTTSADGLTVLDNNTGLTWVQSPDTSGDGSIDSADKRTWTELTSHVAAMNAASYGGFDDWRVPSIKELYSLIDFRGTDPAMDSTPADLTPFVDTTYFAFGYGDVAAGERIIDAQYWSSTEYVSTTMGGAATVFGVNFADGRIKGYPRDMGPGGRAMDQYIRLVRGNTGYGINNFVDNGDGTVIDLATGLMWQQLDSGYDMNWEDALAYAEGLDFADHDDWRLPNAKELHSILDYTRSPGTTTSAAIDPVFSTSVISNETLATDYPCYWTGTTHISAAAGVAGRAGVYVCFGRGMGYMMGSWMDVHGAGCQRSDPKDGVLSDYTYVPYGYYFGNAPQGDAIRIFNYVRAVRDDVSLIFADGFESGDDGAWSE